MADADRPDADRPDADRPDVERLDPLRDEPPRWSGALAIALACAFLAGASFGILVLDFGTHVDGPGIGLEWSKPGGGEHGERSGLVLALGLIHAVLSLFAFSAARAKPIGFLALGMARVSTNEQVEWFASHVTAY